MTWRSIDFEANCFDGRTDKANRLPKTYYENKSRRNSRRCQVFSGTDYRRGLRRRLEKSSQITARYCSSKVAGPAVRRSVPTWQEYRENLSDGLPAIAVDLVLRATALKLNDRSESEAAQERIARNPVGQSVFSNKQIDEVVAGWFELSQLGVARP